MQRSRSASAHGFAVAAGTVWPLRAEWEEKRAARRLQRSRQHAAEVLEAVRREVTARRQASARPQFADRCDRAVGPDTPQLPPPPPQFPSPPPANHPPPPPEAEAARPEAGRAPPPPPPAAPETDAVAPDDGIRTATLMARSLAAERCAASAVELQRAQEETQEALAAALQRVAAQHRLLDAVTRRGPLRPAVDDNPPPPTHRTPAITDDPPPPMHHMPAVLDDSPPREAHRMPVMRHVAGDSPPPTVHLPRAADRSPSPAALAAAVRRAATASWASVRSHSATPCFPPQYRSLSPQPQPPVRPLPPQYRSVSPQPEGLTVQRVVPPVPAPRLRPPPAAPLHRFRPLPVEAPVFAAAEPPRGVQSPASLSTPPPGSPEAPPPDTVPAPPPRQPSAEQRQLGVGFDLDDDVPEGRPSTPPQSSPPRSDADSAGPLLRVLPPAADLSAAGADPLLGSEHLDATVAAQPDSGISVDVGVPLADRASRELTAETHDLRRPSSSRPAGSRGPSSAGSADLGRLAVPNTAVQLDCDEVDVDDAFGDLRRQSAASSVDRSRLAAPNTAVQLDGDEVDIDEALGADLRRPSAASSVDRGRLAVPNTAVQLDGDEVDIDGLFGEADRSATAPDRLARPNTAVAVDNEEVDLAGL